MKQVDRRDFGVITHFFEAEKIERVIELMEELHNCLYDYNIMPEKLDINFSDEGNSERVIEALNAEVKDFYNRELDACKKNLKIKHHTFKPIGKELGVKLYEVGPDKY